MSDSPDLTKPSLIMIQFLSWVADRPRSYAETMEAWRTSCPRLSVWEDAVIANLVRLEGEGARAVKLTSRGAALRPLRRRFGGPFSKGASNCLNNGASLLTSLRWARLSLANIRSARFVRSIRTSRRSSGFCRRWAKPFAISRSISSTALLCRIPRRSARMLIVTRPPGVPLIASSA